MKMIITIILIIILLCSQQTQAKEFDLSGTGILSLTQTNIDNKTIEDIPQGLTIGLEYFVNGRFQDLDINSSLDLNFNNRDDDWDEIVEFFTFGLSNSKTALNLGDLYEDISDFTLSEDMSIRFGLKLNQNIKVGEKTEVMLIGGRLQEASVYETDENENGVLDSNEDKNGNGRWDYDSSYYDQWLAGVRFSSLPTKNTFLGLTYLKINDDKNSNEEQGTIITPPIKNDVYDIESAISFFNHFLTLSGELTRSSKEEVGSITTNYDKAYKFSLKANEKNWNCELGYNYIGNNYYSAGSPYLDVDKKGYFSTVQWLLNEIFSLTLEGERFEDNLISDSQYPVTTTKIVNTTFELKPEKYPQLTLEYELTNEKSNKWTSSYPKLDTFTTDILLELSHSIKNTDLVLNLQQTQTKDNSTDTLGSEYEEYKSNGISLNIDTKFTQRFTLSNYLSYVKNKTGNDMDDTFNTSIDLTYDMIPEKLVFKPGYEFEEYRVEKNCSRKEFTLRMDVDYYLSNISQFTFGYERKKNKDKEDPSTNYKADVGTVKYTRLF